MSGFEGLIPTDGSENFFFSGWLQKSEAAKEFLDRGGEHWKPLTGDPRLGIVVSAIGHLLLLIFMLIEPSLGLLGPKSEFPEVPDIDKTEPLVLFMEDPALQQPPVVVVPVVPDVVAAPEQELPPDPPPQVADNAMIIPKAMLIPPPGKRPDIMNDLPFSEGNTDEFYTEEEVKEPNSEGVPEEITETETLLVEELGADDLSSEAAEGREGANDGTDVAQELARNAVGDLLYGTPSLKEEALAKRQVQPSTPRITPWVTGEGGEEGRFTDIRRFLAGAQFHNSEGGLISNTNNTLYYNDKGANFVPWIRRMLAEVGRIWYSIMPYSVHFDHGHVAVGITVDREGTITGLQILAPSGISGFDNAATGSVRAADLLPLPADYPDDRFDIILVFWYNERPYDLFG
jgi:TonB family protein